MPTYISKATTLPAVEVTLTPKVTEIIIALMRNEANRLDGLNSMQVTKVITCADELRDLCNDLDGTLNQMFPSRRDFSNCR